MEKIRLLGTGIIICLLMMFVSSVNAQKYKSVFKNLTWEQAAEQAAAAQMQQANLNALDMESDADLDIAAETDFSEFEPTE